MTQSVSPEAGPRSVARFTTSVRLAIIAVTVAAIALVLILLPRGEDTPPVAGGSASATAEASPSVTPTPTAEPTPGLTPEPTPTPIARWTALTWSDPVTPSFTVHLNDLLPWDDGYVAVGSVEVDATRSEAAFLTSPDGLNWTITDELLAFSHRATTEGPILGAPPGTYYGPLIWSSTDGGSTWSLVESPSWEQAWTDARVGYLPEGWDNNQFDITSGFVDVASGPDGLVAIGNSVSDDGLIPVVRHSTDGQNWSQVSLPAGAVSPLLSGVVPYDGGFVLVGATDIGADASTATPAAWYSGDGTSWTPATMNVDETLSPEASEGIGFEMGAVAAGADGLVGWMGHSEITIGGPPFFGEWTSADGQTWQMRDANTYPPSYTGLVADDGVRMVALPNTFHEDTGQWSPIDTAWVSTDGVTWNELALSAAMADQPDGFWVVPDGVIYAGVQSFWFGAAQVAE
jgi:hypothetical protein